MKRHKEASIRARTYCPFCDFLCEEDYAGDIVACAHYKEMDWTQHIMVFEDHEGDRKDE